jgi:hypothetical protein
MFEAAPSHACECASIAGCWNEIDVRTLAMSARSDLSLPPAEGANAEEHSKELTACSTPVLHHGMPFSSVTDEVNIPLPDLGVPSNKESRVNADSISSGGVVTLTRPASQNDECQAHREQNSVFSLQAASQTIQGRILVRLMCLSITDATN